MSDAADEEEGVVTQDVLGDTQPITDASAFDDPEDFEEASDEVFAPGMKLGNVELVKKIAEGGMGGVWLAEHPILHKQVAVKLVSSHHSRHKPALAKRIQREAEALAKLDHEHIVRVYDYGETDLGTPYLVLELLHGRTLGRLLRKQKKLPLATVVELVDQIAGALTAAHELGIIHRDIKPANIFLCEHDEPGLLVKVLDFGIAKQVGVSGISSVTATGMMLGTPHFMSPEQLMSPKDVDGRTDLWSLGVVAFASLTGKLPFKGETLAQLFNAITAGAIKRPSELVDDVPRAIDRWFTKALHRDPRLRFASAQEMAEELARAARSKAGDAQALPQVAEVVAPLERPKRPGKMLPYPFALMDGTARRTSSPPPEKKKEAATPLSRTQWLAAALGALCVVGGIVWLTRGRGGATAVGDDLLMVPAGAFDMGCDACGADERPLHQVALPAFYIDRSEVTVRDYRACVDVGVCTTDHVDMASACSWSRGGADALPMNCVSWKEADRFCAWAGKRLPTEAEWERAARGDDSRTYPWGEELTCDWAVLNEAGASCNIGAPLEPASRRDVGPFGTVDMAGNVAEWVADWYAADYYTRAGREAPAGPDGGEERVIRGGGWLAGNADSARASRRRRFAPDRAAVDVGFRCARD